MSGWRRIFVFSGAIAFDGTQYLKVTRYSIDFRTVHLDDVLGRMGAGNVDSFCTGTTMGDYLRGTDFAHLPERRWPSTGMAPKKNMRSPTPWLQDAIDCR